MTVKVAIIGSGDIGTDLMIKVMRLSTVLELSAFVGIDPESDGLKRAERLGVPITAGGIDGFVAMPEFRHIDIVFDATSAAAHAHHSAVLLAHGKRVIDLTPAAIGPYTIPPAASVEAMVAEVQAYVPGYRLKQVVQFEHIGSNRPLHIPRWTVRSPDSRSRSSSRWRGPRSAAAKWSASRKT